MPHIGLLFSRAWALRAGHSGAREPPRQVRTQFVTQLYDLLEHRKVTRIDKKQLGVKQERDAPIDAPHIFQRRAQALQRPAAIVMEKNAVHAQQGNADHLCGPVTDEIVGLMGAGAA